MARKNSSSILFLGKKKDDYTKKVVNYAKQNFSNVQVYLGNWGDPLPDNVKEWRGDYIISYLSRWVYLID